MYFVHCGFHVRNNTLPYSHAPLWHSGVHGYYNWRRGGILHYGPTWELCKMAEPEPPAAVPHSASSQPVLGSLGEFDYRTDSVSSYLEQMQLYFEANAVADDRKVAVLLTVIGAKTYETLRSLLAPERPRDKSYDELKAILLKHYDPQPLVVGERFRFYQRSQKSGESIADFVADLRRLSIKCEFGDFLDQALRDRFVCGVRNAEEALDRVGLDDQTSTRISSEHGICRPQRKGSKRRRYYVSRSRVRQSGNLILGLEEVRILSSLR